VFFIFPSRAFLELRRFVHQRAAPATLNHHPNTTHDGRTTDG